VAPAQNDCRREVPLCKTGTSLEAKPFIYPLVNCHIANWKITIFEFGKSTKNKYAMFNSYDSNYQREIMNGNNISLSRCCYMNCPKFVLFPKGSPRFQRYKSTYIKGQVNKLQFCNLGKSGKSLVIKSLHIYICMYIYIYKYVGVIVCLCIYIYVILCQV
jgi:hypothetical protein